MLHIVSHRERILGLIRSFAIEMQMNEYVMHDVCAKDVREHAEELSRMYRTHQSPMATDSFPV